MKGAQNKVLVIVPLPADLAEQILPRVSEKDRGVFLSALVRFGFEYLKANQREIAAWLDAKGVNPGA